MSFELGFGTRDAQGGVWGPPGGYGPPEGPPGGYGPPGGPPGGYGPPGAPPGGYGPPGGPPGGPGGFQPAPPGGFAPPGGGGKPITGGKQTMALHAMTIDPTTIIKRMEGIDATIGRLIYEHHIKYDHLGYPQTAENLHPHSQIITICDAYDALTTLRVYQKPHDPVEAIKIMSNFSGRHFNPDILKSFMDMMGLYPTGTMVRLATGELGVVLRLNEGAPEKPVIKILYGEDGAEVETPFEADLSTDARREIVTNVNPATTAIDLGAFFENEAAG